MKPKHLQTVVTLLGLLCVSVITLSGCQGNKGIDVPFETIERANFSRTGEYYEGSDPKLVILTDVNQVKVLGNTISHDAQTLLQVVDFGQCFVVAVFIGTEAELFGPKSGVEIHTVQKRSETITISAHFYQPGEDVARKPLKVSPYHLIKIQKKNIRGDFKFTLNINDMDTIYVDSTIP